jgi:hypothetical protein
MGRDSMKREGKGGMGGKGREVKEVEWAMKGKMKGKGIGRG